MLTRLTPRRGGRGWVDAIVRRSSLLMALMVLVPCVSAAQVFSIPSSADAQIRGRIELPDGQSALFSRVEGGIVTIRDEASGALYALVANLKDAPQGKVNVLALEVLESPDGQQSAEQLDFAKIKLGHSHRLATPIGAFDLTLTAIENGSLPSRYLPDGLAEIGEKEEDLLGDIFQPLCCVTCNGFTVCADTVSLDCGSCGPGGGFLAK